MRYELLTHIKPFSAPRTIDYHLFENEYSSSLSGNVDREFCEVRGAVTFIASCKHGVSFVYTSEGQCIALIVIVLHDLNFTEKSLFLGDGIF